MRGKREGYVPRSKKLQVYVRPDEEALLKQRAKEAGFNTVPAYLRAIGLDGGAWFACQKCPFGALDEPQERVACLTAREECLRDSVRAAQELGLR